MKRYVRAWYTGEPSVSEYGDFLQKRHERMQDRYYPFNVRDINFAWKWAITTTGYRITLDNKEWIADYKGSDFNKTLILYGPYAPNQIKDWPDLKSDKKIREGFKSIDSVISYLYETEDVEV